MGKGARNLLNVDAGLLFMRVGLGIMFVSHGFPKIIGGPEKWSKVGSAMANLGLDFAPAFWGLAAGLSEFLGGLLIAVGLLTRPASALLAFTMFVAAIKHLSAGDAFPTVSHPLEALIVFVALFLMGPGRFALDPRFLRERMEKKRTKEAQQ